MPRILPQKYSGHKTIHRLHRLPFIHLCNLWMALTLLPRSHSMATPFESETDGRVGLNEGTYVNGRRLPLQGRGWGFESLRAYQRKQFFAES